MGTCAAKCCTCCLPNPAVLCDYREVNQLARRKGLRFKSGFYEKYSVGKQLGRGNFASVHVAVDNETGEVVAAKTIKKYSQALMSKQDYIDLVNEISVMSKLRHPNVVRLLDYYNERGEFVIVQEIVHGGELYDRIVKQGHYSERDAREYVIDIVKAMQFCHRLGIAHRDLKPQNILLTSDSEEGRIKICDFGFSREVQDDFATTPCGTLTYMAPEIIKRKPYTHAVDCWSMGCVFWVMLCGKLPFRGNRATIKRRIKAGKLDFSADSWAAVSDLAIDFLRKVLVVDPAKRLTCRQMLKHPWLTASEQWVPNSELTAARAGLRDIVRHHVVAIRGAVRLARMAQTVMADRNAVSAHGAIGTTPKSSNGARGGYGSINGHTAGGGEGSSDEEDDAGDFKADFTTATRSERQSSVSDRGEAHRRDVPGYGRHENHGANGGGGRGRIGGDGGGGGGGGSNSTDDESMGNAPPVPRRSTSRDRNGGRRQPPPRGYGTQDGARGTGGATWEPGHTYVYEGGPRHERQSEEGVSGVTAAQMLRQPLLARTKTT